MWKICNICVQALSSFVHHPAAQLSIHERASESVRRPSLHSIAMPEPALPEQKTTDHFRKKHESYMCKHVYYMCIEGSSQCGQLCTKGSRLALAVSLSR